MEELLGAFCPSDWSLRKVLKIQPDKDEFENRLKPCRYLVWVESNSINHDYCGSELVVIWFDEFPNGRSVEEIIQNVVKHIDWNKNAEDFDY